MQTIYRCFHCGLEHELGDQFELVFDDKVRTMCCAGCLAAAQAILDAGLEEYYRHRQFDKAHGQTQLIPDALRDVSIYDNTFILNQFAESDGDIHSIVLMLEGLTCDACAWLIERQIKRIPGLIDGDVNYSNLTARITWAKKSVKLSDIIKAIEQLGYRVQPYEARRYFKNLQQQRRELLKRIGVAAGFGMQVMIVSVAMYFGDYYGMDDALYGFFTNIALLMTLPVLVYSGRGFFATAFAQLKARQLGMDVPVSIGLALAFSASLINTIKSEGHVYYDSVCMFVFFLLIARYFVHNARLNAANAIERLSQSLPVFAERLSDKKENAKTERIIAQQINEGDWVRVLKGRTIPCDGAVVMGESRVDRAILTGESTFKKVGPEDEVFAGSINRDAPIIVEAVRSGGETLLEYYSEMAREAASRKVGHSLITDLFARWFTLGVLGIAIMVATIWYFIEPSNVLPITIAVLVVSCPCALSLATPVTLSVTTSTLFRKGVLTHNVEQLEVFTKCSDVVFDKTGTLTEDASELVELELFTTLDEQRILQLVASLETNSEHPISRAIQQAHIGDLLIVKEWQERIGAGVEGIVEHQRHFLGSKAYIESNTSHQIKSDGIYLANKDTLMAKLSFSASLRQSAKQVIDALKRNGIGVHLLTGDEGNVADAVAKKLGIEAVLARASPEDKQQYLLGLKAENRIVIAVGDGVNDAPLLASADAAIAVSGATPAAIEGADFVLIAQNLDRLEMLFKVAQLAKKTIKQNLSWAIGYNLLAIPFAALGLIQPVFAAIGMSLSSILVVVNALLMQRKV